VAASVRGNFGGCYLEVAIGGSLRAGARGMSRALVGAMSSFDQFARRHLHMVRAMLVRRLGDHPELDDLVQHVFLELHRAMPRFRGDSTLSTFLGGFVVRTAHRARRRARRQRTFVALDAALRDPAPDPEQRAISREQLRRAQRAIEGLSPQRRAAFELWALEGRRVEEISALIESSESAVRGRIFQAQQTLARARRRDPSLAELC
jgi:RNA polymerase sigma-70 factor, ECF subfamily